MHETLYDLNAKGAQRLAAEKLERNGTRYE